jgi:hypothetical protein
MPSGSGGVATEEMNTSGPTIFTHVTCLQELHFTWQILFSGIVS